MLLILNCTSDTAAISHSPYYSKIVILLFTNWVQYNVKFTKKLGFKRSVQVQRPIVAETIYSTYGYVQDCKLDTKKVQILQYTFKIPYN